MTREEAHAVLGVDPGASQEEIRAAFHRAAFWCHPDRNPGNRVAAEAFRRVTRAYELLKHPAWAHDEDDEHDRASGRRSAAERAADEWAAAAERAAAERAAAERAAGERAARERATARRRLLALAGTAVGLAVLAPQLVTERGASAASLPPTVTKCELPPDEAAAAAPGEAEPDAARPFGDVSASELARLVAPEGTAGAPAAEPDATVKAAGLWSTRGADRLVAVLALGADASAPAGEGACQLVVAGRAAGGALARTAALPVPEHACSTRAFTSLQTKGYAFDAARELLGLYVSELHQGYGTISQALYRLDGKALTRVLAVESEVVPDAPRLDGVETEPDGAGPSRVVIRFRSPDGAELPRHVYAWNGRAYVESELRPAPKADGTAEARRAAEPPTCPDPVREPEPAAESAAGKGPAGTEQTAAVATPPGESAPVERPDDGTRGRQGPSAAP